VSVGCGGDGVADRLGIDQDKAEALAAEPHEQSPVRVGGGHSLTLAPEGKPIRAYASLLSHHLPTFFCSSRSI
jgi:hypothetical protein